MHLFLCSILMICVAARSVTLSNIVPRRDVNGAIMDIHDGNTFLLDGKYYYYGASYGDCPEPVNTTDGCSDFGVGNCGFRLDHNVSLFTSHDLSTWTPHKPVFQFEKDHPTPGIMFCPKVLYNAMTNKFVLWYNWIDIKQGFAASYYGVAISDVPHGPFKVVNPHIKTLAWTDTGDFGLFQDHDGAGYIIYTSHIQGNWTETHTMSIERLSDDYLMSLGASHNSGFFGDSFVEAPTMFRRHDRYYAVFGQCCCYCGEGSPVKYYTSHHPLGPYSEGILLTDSTIPAQQTFILPYESTHGLEFLWQGDRWQSSPDGTKGHDFSYWAPIHFDHHGRARPMSWESKFKLKLRQH